MILPMLWLRLVVVIGFTIFVAIQQMWPITAIGVVLTLLTGYQIYRAYSSRCRFPEFGEFLP